MPWRMNSRLIVLMALSCPSQIGTVVRIRIGEAICLKEITINLEAKKTGKTNWNLISWLPGFLIKLLLDMADPLDFAGKVVLVTGSSRGIGAEMIKAFGKHGAECVVNYVDRKSTRLNSSHRC